MDISAHNGAAAGARPAPGDAPRGAAPEFDTTSGWLVLRDCPLGGGGPRIGLVLLHPKIGVALVDFAAKPTDAAGRLRRALDARRFSAIFGGHPPVARAVLPAERLPDLGRVLLAEFKAKPPLALAGGDAWVRLARAAIEAEDPAAVPEPPRGAGRLRAFPWRAAALAGVAGGAVGLLVMALAPPGRSLGNPAAPAVVADAALGVARLSPHGTASPGHDMTERDVLAALASADPVTGAGGGAAGGPAEAVAGPTPAEMPSGAWSGAPSASAPAESRSVDGPAHAAPDAAPPAAMAAAAAEGAEPSPARAGTPVAAAAAVESHSPTASTPAGTSVPQPQAPLPDRAPPAAPVLADTRPAPKRPAALAEAPRVATATMATGGRRAALPAAPAETTAGGRCNAIMARATVGGALSDDDREHLRRGCEPRG